jgi:hypothetical protein
LLVDFARKSKNSENRISRLVEQAPLGSLSMPQMRAGVGSALNDAMTLLQAIKKSLTGLLLPRRLLVVFAGTMLFDSLNELSVVT